MPEFLSDMDFEQKLNEMGDNQTELIRFIARQQYQTSKLCPVHNQRISKLEAKTKKETGVVGGVGAAVGIVIASAIDFFMRRGS